MSIPIRRILAFACAALLSTAAAAQETAATEPPVDPPAEGAFAPIDVEDADLEQFLWQNFPIVVFADTPADPAFNEQMGLLEERWDDLAQREAVVITDTDPSRQSAIRRELRPRGFMLVLIAKDGRVALRKPFPWDVRELSRAIDRME